MENYYEYLEIDMSATIEEIKEALNNSQSKDGTYLRKIKSILLNENFKSEYDKRLANHIMGNHDKKISVNLNISQLKKLDDGTLHDTYIYIVFGLMLINFISLFTLSNHIDSVINFIVMVTTTILLYKDWQILEKNNIAVFSKWWILLLPVYLYKRSNTKKEDKRFFWFWVAISVIFITSFLIFKGGKSSIEAAACDIVTDIYKNQFYKSAIKCTDVTITESSGKNHVGLAELTNGRVNKITIQELNNGQIYVTVNQN